MHAESRQLSWKWFRKPAMEYKPTAEMQWQNQPMAEKKSLDLNFEEASKTLYLIFSANYQTVILEKLQANVQKLFDQF